jgi:hypothetical protein
VIVYVKNLPDHSRSVHSLIGLDVGYVDHGQKPTQKHLKPSCSPIYIETD